MNFNFRSIIRITAHSGDAHWNASIESGTQGKRPASARISILPILPVTKKLKNCNYLIFTHYSQQFDDSVEQYCQLAQEY